jgi:hypothetical protein
MTARYDGFEIYLFLVSHAKAFKAEYHIPSHQLTASPEWNPHARLFDEMERAMTNEEGFSCNNPQRRSIYATSTLMLCSIDCRNTYL